ncbi:hypothetical protein BV923_20990 [Pectobacterium odoriferum]|uniref:integrase n=1 Tax=Pectobacterium odoriferum TaxID=78398 RepID=UPI000CD2A7C7|nr:integrase [Pectobacterium odoriferum]POE18504.1 hypothetical protein BV923_20990 [Pectobacterium odoriferum]
MTEKIIFFKEKRELDAEVNMKDFINFCKFELRPNESGIDWNSSHWLNIFTFTKCNFKGRSSGRIRKEDEFDEDFIDFAKSYVIYHYFNNGGKNNKLTFKGALKSLENKLIKINKNPNVIYLNITVLNECIEYLKHNYSESVAYQCGNELQRIVVFLNKKGLLKTGFLSWVNPLRPPETDNVISKKADLNRLRKLPSEQAISAIGEIFSLPDDDLSDKDMFVTSVFALLMCAPSRISEVLALPADCEISESDRDGKMRYGLRFYSLKKFNGNIKWIPDIMVPVAKKAISRLLKLSKNARDLSRLMEDNNRTLPNNHPVPKNFPWYDKDKNIKYSNALCVLNKYQLSKNKTLNNVIFKPTSEIFSNYLGDTRNRSRQNIFQIYGYVRKKDAPLFLRTHQARHLLNTIAQRGGLGELDIAKWSGRATVTQNRVYNHISEEQMLQKAKSLNINGEVLTPGVLDETDMNLPSTLKDISVLNHGAIHITEFGYCAHDYMISPCDKFRDCIHCDEQLCVKGDSDKLSRMKEVYSATEALHSKALSSMNEEELGADKWFLHQDKTLKTLKGIITIMEDDNVKDGSVIKLNNNGFSHLNRVIVNNKVIKHNIRKYK